MSNTKFLKNPNKGGSSSTELIGLAGNLIDSGSRIIQSVSGIVQSCNSRDAEMFKISQIAQLKHEQNVMEMRKFDTEWKFKSDYMDKAFSSDRFTGQMLLEAFKWCLEK